MKLDSTDRLLLYQRNNVNRYERSVLPGSVHLTKDDITLVLPPAEPVADKAILSTVKDERLSERASDVAPAEGSVKSQKLKFDAGKAPVQRAFIDYFPRAIAAVANVSAFGANKYSVPYEERAWTKVKDAEGRYRDAKGRHAAPPTGELYAQDSQLLHAAHEAWNAMAVLELMLTRGVKERNDDK